MKNRIDVKKAEDAEERIVEKLGSRTAAGKELDGLFKPSTEYYEKKNGINYDKMLWGHINWDKMFQNVITELSELYIPEGLKELSENTLIDNTEVSELNSLEDFGKLFEETLVDYVPYVNIKYENLHSEEDRKRVRQDAIEWVHLRHGSGLFKQTFYEKFSGKNLQEFDKRFFEFISEYLEKRKPNDYSIGSLVRKMHISISKYEAEWHSIDGVQQDDVSDEESDSEKLFREYVDNVRNNIKKLEEYQQKFDALHVDINDV